MIFVSIVGSVLCFARPFEENNTYVLGRAYGKILLPLNGLHIKVLGKEIFDQIPGPAVLISNHQNNFDAFVIGTFVPKKTVSVGKKIIRLFPFFGQIYWLSGNILIDRKRKKKALGAMKQAGDKMKERGIKVWIMPEGTRSKGRGLLPFKKGAFHLAKQTDLPVIPVVLSHYANRMDLNSFKKTPILAKVCEPIDSTKFATPDELKDHCHQLFVRELEVLDKILDNESKTVSKEGAESQSV